MPTSKKPSSKLRYSALFAGRRPTSLPYSSTSTDIQKAVDNAVRDIVQRRPQLNDGVENIEQNRLEGSGRIVAEVIRTVPVDTMPPVAIFANRERLKVKIDKDFLHNGNGGQSSNKRRWTMNGKLPGLATTFRYRMRNVLLVSRCSDPSLSRAVACVIWDGYDASTASWLHLHVFWFVGHDGSGGSKSDTLQTEVGNTAAETFARHMSRYIDTPEHKERIRHLGADMVARGQLDLRATTSGDVSSRVAPRRSFSVPSPVTSPATEITSVVERSTFITGSTEAGTTPRDDIDAAKQSGQHGVNGHVINNGVSEVNGNNKTNEMDGEAVSFVVNQRGRVRLSATNAAAARSSFAATNGSSVDHSSRQTVGDAPPTFTTDHGLSPDDVDCTALRSRIARFNQLVANDNGNQQPVSYFRYESSSPYDDGMYSTVSSLERSGGTSTVQVPAPIASLSGELKSRFSSGAPILLPPKDYDTVNRYRGNLVGIEVRRCQQENVVGRTSAASSIF